MRKTLTSPRVWNVSGIELFALSLVTLFQELAFIRWIPSQVRVIAYFPNLVLIAAFLGLGVGALRARKGNWMQWWPVLLLVVVVSTVLLSRVVFTANDTSEHLWLLYYDLGDDATVINGVRAPLIFFFVIIAASFGPLGHGIASRLESFRRKDAPLLGYAIDLGGSLVGVTLFSVLSFSGTTPTLWFAGFLALGFIVLRSLPRTGQLLGGVLAVVIVGVVALTEKADLYSPYYSITVEPIGTHAMAVLTNGSLHQIASRVRRDSPILVENESIVRSGFHLPFQYLEETPRTALVLGAGTGNDVSVLLDQGVEHIDAVEIDPVIYRIGREGHPESPYDSDRVEVFVTDARSFLNHTDRTYDLIVFGTLDSMTRLSALSNVRLDNFVYTLESIQTAREHLNPDGGLVMLFEVGQESVHSHLLGLLTTAFGTIPAVATSDWSLFNTVYMAGPAFADVNPLPPEELEAYRTEILPTLHIPTDDWPYLYLPQPEIGSFYLSLLAVFLTLAGGAIFVASPEMRQGLVGKGGNAIDWEMILYGVGFLLLETRFVTTMNLVWGATWITSAVVFGSILFTILLGTLLTHYTRVPWRLAAVGLLASLAVVYFYPAALITGLEFGPRLLLSVLYVGTPVFFAGICFAASFQSRTHADVAFGWNLLGAVGGGLLEFIGMATGLKFLLVVAGGAYLVAFLVHGSPTMGHPPATNESATPST